MKNRAITITKDQINSQVPIFVNATMVFMPTEYNVEPSTPQGIYFQNKSGEDIEFNTLTFEEMKDYAISSTGLVGVLVPNNEIFQHTSIFGTSSLDNVHFIVVKGLGSSASSNLTIYLLDYR